MAKQSELTLIFRRERQVFRNGSPDSPDFRRTIIGECENGTEESVTVKGDAAEGQLLSGMSYRFYGHWTEHYKYGRQFVFANFIAEEPATEDGIVAYLSALSGERIGVKVGIGKGKAYALWEEYGPQAVEILRTDPQRVAADVKGISKATAEAAAKYLIRNQAIEKCKIDLMGLLNGRGFPKKTIDLAIQKYGATAAERIRHNPYLLMSFRGCGFLGTDKMYLDLGRDPQRLKRQALCCWYAIASNTDGHTWHPYSAAEMAVRKNVAGAAVDPSRAVELAIRAGMLADYYDENGQRWIAEGRKANNEERLAVFVRDAAEESGEWPFATSADGPSDHQKEHLRRATQATIGILAGSPGTGKTYSAAAVIDAIIAEFGSACIAAVAPTGKAAVRLTESLAAAGIGITASTIHRLLGVISADDGGWEFNYNEANPLPQRFVIIDESSMIDTDLMASLFAARAPGTHYLFLGDHRQLAPVGHGCPFLDLQKAGVPTGELTEIRRNSGRIVQACAEIRDHKWFDVSPQVNLEAGENLCCRETEMPVDTLDVCLSQLKVNGTDILWDVQIVVAVNAKSPLSRKILNAHLQTLLNPAGETCKGNPFRVGDKVINLKNGFFPAEGHCPEANEDGNLFVANGEQAEVVRVEPARTIVRLQSPQRIVVIPHGKVKEPDANDENDAEQKGSAGSWDLGYAITVHKSQGSEWPVVIVMLDEYPGAKMVCSRNWLYTAISRAKKLCVMIGKKTTADAAVRRDGLRRKTFLAERIQGVQQKRPIKTEPPRKVRLSREEFEGLFT